MDHLKRFTRIQTPLSSLGIFLCVSILVTAGGIPSFAEESAEQPDLPQTIVKEARASIDRGAEFLLNTQKDNGSWRGMASITGLAVTALHGSESERFPERVETAVEKGRKFILAQTRENGAIAASREKYTNYATSICLTTLATLNRPEDTDVMRDARKFLLDMQLDEDHPQYDVSEDDDVYGGWAYGSGEPDEPAPNLSTTQWAIEALYLTDYLDTEQGGATAEKMKRSDLAWDKALKFLEEVQGLPEDADRKWVTTQLEDSERYDGGFYYGPDESKAGSLESPTGEQVEGGLRTYGSMTYAGLKSMIYADLESGDPRVKAATEWARKNYELEKNPGIGYDGYLYYLNTFAKAFEALGKEQITTEDGEKHYWRLDLIKQLLRLQKGDGQWINEESGRWMESIPELVTPYAMISMELALGDQL